MNKTLLVIYSGRDNGAYRGQGQCTISTLYTQGEAEGKEVHHSFNHYDRRRDAYTGKTIGGDERGDNRPVEIKADFILRKWNPTGTCETFSLEDSQGNVLFACHNTNYGWCEECEECHFDKLEEWLLENFPQLVPSICLDCITHPYPQCWEEGHLIVTERWKSENNNRFSGMTIPEIRETVRKDNPEAIIKL